MTLIQITENNVEKVQRLEAELNTYKKRCEQYALAYEQLRLQVVELRRHRFGKKSERFIETENPQLSLLQDNDTLFKQAMMGADVVESDANNKKPQTRKKSTRSEKALPKRIEIIPVCEADKKCSCGACKTVIRYVEKELLHYQPPVHEILVQQREIVACPKGCDGEMRTAPAPLHVLPKAKTTEEFLAYLIVSKLDDRQPLYHLAKQLYSRHGLGCSRQTMARWLIELILPLQPIMNLLKDYVIDYDIASCDATMLQVLNEPGRLATTKSYLYCMRGGPPEKSVILYDYNNKLHKHFLKDWFEGFKGYLHVDGDPFFELVGNFTALVNCNAHARRKFEPIAAATTGEGLAKKAMRFFKALYKIEREAKDNKLTPEKRHQLRQEKSKPLMDEFKHWLDEMFPTVLPQSPLGDAMEYCLKLWPGLTRFLGDGRLEIDNNLTEQAIKPFVIARKNFMFASSMNGAKALCVHMSLIRTAKAHGIDPYHYYVKLLKAIPHCKNVEDYETLLPWNIKLSPQIGNEMYEKAA